MSIIHYDKDEKRIFKNYNTAFMKYINLGDDGLDKKYFKNIFDKLRDKFKEIDSLIDDSLLDKINKYYSDNSDYIILDSFAKKFILIYTHNDNGDENSLTVINSNINNKYHGFYDYYGNISLTINNIDYNALNYHLTKMKDEYQLYNIVIPDIIKDKSRPILIYDNNTDFVYYLQNKNIKWFNYYYTLLFLFYKFLPDKKIELVELIDCMINLYFINEIKIGYIDIFKAEHLRNAYNYVCIIYSKYRDNNIDEFYKLNDDIYKVINFKNTDYIEFSDKKIDYKYKEFKLFDNNDISKSVIKDTLDININDNNFLDITNVVYETFDYNKINLEKEFNGIFVKQIAIEIKNICNEFINYLKTKKNKKHEDFVLIDLKIDMYMDKLGNIIKEHKKDYHIQYLYLMDARGKKNIFEKFAYIMYKIKNLLYYNTIYTEQNISNSYNIKKHYFSIISEWFELKLPIVGTMPSIKIDSLDNLFGLNNNIVPIEIKNHNDICNVNEPVGFYEEYNILGKIIEKDSSFEAICKFETEFRHNKSGPEYIFKYKFVLTSYSYVKYFFKNYTGFEYIYDTEFNFDDQRIRDIQLISYKQNVQQNFEECNIKINNFYEKREEYIDYITNRLNIHIYKKYIYENIYINTYNKIILSKNPSKNPSKSESYKNDINIIKYLTTYYNIFKLINKNITKAIKLLQKTNILYLYKYINYNNNTKIKYMYHDTYNAIENKDVFSIFNISYDELNNAISYIEKCDIDHDSLIDFLIFILSLIELKFISLDDEQVVESKNKIVKLLNYEKNNGNIFCMTLYNYLTNNKNIETFINSFNNLLNNDTYKISDNLNQNKELYTNTINVNYIILWMLIKNKFNTNEYDLNIIKIYDNTEFIYDKENDIYISKANNRLYYDNYKYITKIIKPTELYLKTHVKNNSVYIHNIKFDIDDSLNIKYNGNIIYSLNFMGNYKYPSYKKSISILPLLLYIKDDSLHYLISNNAEYIVNKKTNTYHILFDDELYDVIIYMGYKIDEFKDIPIDILEWVTIVPSILTKKNDEYYCFILYSNDACLIYDLVKVGEKIDTGNSKLIRIEITDGKCYFDSDDDMFLCANELIYYNDIVNLSKFGDRLRNYLISIKEKIIDPDFYYGDYLEYINGSQNPYNKFIYNGKYNTYDTNDNIVSYPLNCLVYKVIDYTSIVYNKIKNLIYYKLNVNIIIKYDKEFIDVYYSDNYIYNNSSIAVMKNICGEFKNKIIKSVNKVGSISKFKSNMYFHDKRASKKLNLFYDINIKNENIINKITDTCLKDREFINLVKKLDQTMCKYTSFVPQDIANLNSIEKDIFTDYTYYVIYNNKYEYIRKAENIIIDKPKYNYNVRNYSFYNDYILYNILNKNIDDIMLYNIQTTYNKNYDNPISYDDVMNQPNYNYIDYIYLYPYIMDIKLFEITFGYNLKCQQLNLLNNLIIILETNFYTQLLNRIKYIYNVLNSVDQYDQSDNFEKNIIINLYEKYGDNKTENISEMKNYLTQYKLNFNINNFKANDITVKNKFDYVSFNNKVKDIVTKLSLNQSECELINSYINILNNIEYIIEGSISKMEVHRKKLISEQYLLEYYSSKLKNHELEKVKELYNDSTKWTIDNINYIIIMDISYNFINNYNINKDKFKNRALNNLLSDIYNSSNELLKMSDIVTKYNIVQFYNYKAQLLKYNNEMLIEYNNTIVTYIKSFYIEYGDYLEKQLNNYNELKGNYYINEHNTSLKNTIKNLYDTEKILEKKNIVPIQQLLMGSGKTSVIAPLLSMICSKYKYSFKQIIINCMPQHLINDSYKIMNNYISRFGVFLTKNDIGNRLGIYLTTPSHIKQIILRSLSSTSNQKLYEDNTRDNLIYIFDEIHDICDNIRSDYIIEKKSESFDNIYLRSQIIIYIINYFYREQKYSNKNYYYENDYFYKSSKENFNSKFIEDVSNILNNKFERVNNNLEKITEYMNNDPTIIIKDEHDMELINEEDIQNYVKKYDELYNYDNLNKLFIEYINVLNNPVGNKQLNYEFGKSPTRKIAVPYIALNKPHPTNKFKDINSTLFYTILVYMYQEISVYDMFDFIVYLHSINNYNYRKIRKEIKEYYGIIVNYNNINKYKHNVKNYSKEEFYTEKHIYEKEKYLESEDYIYYITNILEYRVVIFNDEKDYKLTDKFIPYYISYISNTTNDLRRVTETKTVSMTDIIQYDYSRLKIGFSGTPFLHLINDPDINKTTENYNVIIDEEIHDLYRIKKEMYNKEKFKFDKIGYQLGANGEMYHTLTNNTVKIYKHNGLTFDIICNIMKENNYDVFIDCGAICIYDTDNIVIKKLMDVLNKNYGVYIDKYDDKYLVSKNGSEYVTTLYNFNNIKDKLDQVVTYFDNGHTLGVDLKLHRTAKGLLYVGEKNTYNQVIQGVFRLRQINKGQTISFVYDDNKISRIKDNSKDLFKFLINNELEKQKLNYKIFACQLSRTCKKKYDSHITIDKISELEQTVEMEQENLKETETETETEAETVTESYNLNIIIRYLDKQIEPFTDDIKHYISIDIKWSNMVYVSSLGNQNLGFNCAVIHNYILYMMSEAELYKRLLLKQDLKYIMPNGDNNLVFDDKNICLYLTFIYTKKYYNLYDDNYIIQLMKQFSNADKGMKNKLIYFNNNIAFSNYYLDHEIYKFLLRNFI